MRMPPNFSILALCISVASCLPVAAEPGAPGAGAIWERAKELVPGPFRMKTWQIPSATVPWPARSYHQTVVVGDTMWLYGGSGATTILNDVWYSQNGTTWTEAIAHAAWAPRFFSGGVSFDNKMWEMGGLDGRNFLNDVHSSMD